MNKRILFVGGDSDERDDVEQALGAMARVWDMDFAPNAAKALELMSKDPFEAVVTGLRLPDVSGADLLNKVGELHPRTLRFIRGSFADQSLIMACVWGIHHFIPEPCSGPELVTILSRGLGVTDWLSNEALKGLLSRLSHFPPLPTLYSEVMKQLESPSASVEAIAGIVGKDLAMTAKLLQMVNSAFFGFQQKITSVHDAITILGMETVKAIVLSIHAFSHYEKTQLGRFSIERLWSHSIAVATEAKRITRAQTGDQAMADEAFTAGLLHDIGKLALAANFSEKFDQVHEHAQAEKVTLPEAEKKLLGATHCEAGAYLLGVWGMPISLIESALFHHQPGTCRHNAFSPLTAVHIANVLSHDQRPDTSGGSSAALDTAYIEALGLDSRMEAWREGAAGTAVKPRPSRAPSTENSPDSFVPPSSPKIEAPRLSLAGERSSGRSGLTKILVPALAVGAVAAGGYLGWMTITKLDSTIAEAKARHGGIPSASPLHSAPAKSGKLGSPSETASHRGSPGPMSMFPDLRLQDVSCDWVNSSATINGRSLHIGDQIDGVVVVEVTPTSVSLRFNEEIRTIHLP